TRTALDAISLCALRSVTQCGLGQINIAGQGTHGLPSSNPSLTAPALNSSANRRRERCCGRQLGWTSFRPWETYPPNPICPRTTAAGPELLTDRKLTMEGVRRLSCSYRKR